jgi:hypothetical protein
MSVTAAVTAVTVTGTGHTCNQLCNRTDPWPDLGVSVLRSQFVTTPDPGWWASLGTFGHAIVIVLLIIVVALFWRWHILTYPWHDCWLCGGDTKRRTTAGSMFGTCWACGGTGRRLRIGARILRVDGTTGKRRRKS